MRSVLLDRHGFDVSGVQVYFADLVRRHRIDLFEPGLFSFTSLAARDDVQMTRAAVETD